MIETAKSILAGVDDLDEGGETREGNVHISNKSARGWSLREANVFVSTTGAPHDGHDTERTLRTIIWYKRACISNQRDNLLSLSQPLKKDVNKNVVIEQVPH